MKKTLAIITTIMILFAGTAFAIPPAPPAASVTLPTFPTGTIIGSTDAQAMSSKQLVLIGTSLTAGSVYTADLVLAKADSLTTLRGACVAISTTQCAYSGKYQFGSTQSWTAKDVLYVSNATAGAILNAAPTTSNHFIQIIGVAIDDKTILINPSYDVGTVK